MTETSTADLSDCSEIGRNLAAERRSSSIVAREQQHLGKPEQTIIKCDSCVAIMKDSLDNTTLQFPFNGCIYIDISNHKTYLFYDHYWFEAEAEAKKPQLKMHFGHGQPNDNHIVSETKLYVDIDSASIWKYENMWKHIGYGSVCSGYRRPAHEYRHMRSTKYYINSPAYTCNAGPYIFMDINFKNPIILDFRNDPNLKEFVDCLRL